MELTKTNSAGCKGRYEHLVSKRQPFLDRGRACSELTLPAMLPPDGSEGSSYFVSPFQSVGSKGVNNLASKIMSALMPPSDPFFRFASTAADMESAGLTIAEGEVALAAMESAVLDEINVKAIRVPVFEALKHLIVSGNCLLYMTPKDGMKVFRLDRYVVRRDAMGNPVEIITKESISPTMLPQYVKEAMKDPMDKWNDETESTEEDVELYTYVRRTPRGSWVLTQEVDGVEIQEATAKYPKGKCPFLPLRLTALDGEDYGRGYVEEYIGDLKSLESLTKALVEGSQAAARVLFLVKPHGTTRARTLQELPNGGIGQGDATDISTIQLDKQADFSIVRQTMEDISTRLEQVFLVGQSVQRKGERVSSFEIQYLAEQLELNIGSIYSQLAMTLQTPMVELILHQLQRQRKLPHVPKDLVKTQVVTGIAAFGRSNDYQRLKMFREDITQAASMAQHSGGVINFNEYVLRVASSLSVEPQNLVKTEEQTAKETQSAQRAAMGQEVFKKSAPDVINQMAKEAVPAILGTEQEVSQ